jgi:type IV pilus assembly protein PilN
MIRINLLTKKRERKKEVKEKAGFLLMIGVLTLGSLLILSGVTVFLKHDILKLKKDREANKLTMAELQRKIQEVKRYEELNKEITYRSSVIETLRKNQSIPVKILNDLSISLPDGVWLSSLNYKEEGSDLEGYAFSNANIVSFVENLKRLDTLRDVYLIESKEAEVEKTKVYNFKIAFNVRI